MPAKTYEQSHPLTQEQVLDRDFLEHRARLLDVAAFLDRLDRARPDPSQDNSADPRVTAIQKALAILADNQPHRARRLLESMSDLTTEPIATPASQSALGVPPTTAQP
ncbi:hypothetical protein [Mucisphaera sp.]|uniref:hypothetical protein n=1 Tax=Mucisphaera sp. TaxID=2913024 RepID=UPI003D119E5C